MSMTDIPVLTLIIMAPLVAVTLISLLPDASKARWVALGAAIADLILIITVVGTFDPDKAGFQFVQRVDWIPSINVHYHVGLDGISVLFLPLTMLLFLGVMVAGLLLG